MPIVVDASVTMAWGFEDESTRFTEAVLDRVQIDGALVPAIWPVEVANSILIGERRGRLSRGQADAFVDLLKVIPVTNDEETSLRAWSEILSLARETSLSAYDASYVDLASRRALPLATIDRRMREAAVQLGVQLVEFATEGVDEDNERV